MDDDSAHVDAVQLTDFATLLSTTLTNYGKALEVLDARLASLGRSWRDEQFQEFRREVTTTRQIVDEFIVEGRVAHQNLLEDAQRARDYEKINLRG